MRRAAGRGRQVKNLADRSLMAEVVADRLFHRGVKPARRGRRRAANTRSWRLDRMHRLHESLLEPHQSLAPGSLS
jgi:hypothetical protein